MKRLLVVMLVSANIMVFIGCRHVAKVSSSEISDENSPNLAAEARLKDLKFEDIEPILTSLHDLLHPQTEEGQLQSRLYWCAIYSLWSAFPMGRLTTKAGFLTHLRQNRSGFGGRLLDLKNAITALKRLASAEESSLEDRIKQGFSVCSWLISLLVAVPW